MEPGLTVTVTLGWLDLVQLRIEASNGAFFGTANVNADEDVAKAWADAIRGFPKVTTDSRLIECGAPGGDAFGGHARLRFYCVGSSGYAEVEVLLVSQCTDLTEAGQSVKLKLGITAAAVDDFVCQLQGLSLDGNRVARLSGGKPPSSGP